MFVFGDMEFKTELSPSKIMTYKDHVAAVVRCKEDVYIFDPSVYCSKPILLMDWAKILEVNSDPLSLKYSLCSEYTFAHNSPIDATSTNDEEGFRAGEMRSTEFFTQDFLEKEYRWILALGLDPSEVLGDTSPWK